MPVRSRKKRSEKEKKLEGEDDQVTDILANAMEQLGINIKDVSKTFTKEKFDQILQSMTENMEKEGEAGTKPFIYGFRIGVDENGMPDFSEYGDMSKLQNQEEKVVSESNEPLSEVFKEEKQIRIVCEIPGVDPRNISIRGEEGKIIIEALGAKNYKKEIQIIEEVEMEKGTASYRNGILEILVPRGKGIRANFVDIVITE